jgi:hypothetical protein
MRYKNILDECVMPDIHNASSLWHKQPTVSFHILDLHDFQTKISILNLANSQRLPQFPSFNYWPLVIETMLNDTATERRNAVCWHTIYWSCRTQPRAWQSCPRPPSPPTLCVMYTLPTASLTLHSVTSGKPSCWALKPGIFSAVYFLSMFFYTYNRSSLEKSRSFIQSRCCEVNRKQNRCTLWTH